MWRILQKGGAASPPSYPTFRSRMEGESVWGQREMNPCFWVGRRADLDAVAAIAGLAGADGLLSRDSKGWNLPCDIMYWNQRRIELDRQSAQKSDTVRWEELLRVDLTQMEMLCLRLRFSRVRWERDLFTRLCVQCNCWSAVEVATFLVSSARNEGSSVYVGFSFGRSRQYVGMVEKRSWGKRAKEHLQQIRLHKTHSAEPFEMKYDYMAKGGQWFFLPVINTTEPLPIKDLECYEKVITKEFKKPLNKFFQNSTTKTNSVSRPPWRHGVSPPKTRVQKLRDPMVYTSVDTTQWLPSVDFRKSIDTSDNWICWHSSNPLDLTEIVRKWGHSMVTIITDDSSESCNFRRAVKIAKSAAGQIYLYWEEKIIHVPTPSEARQKLIDIARREYPVATLKELLVQELWILLSISNEVATSKMHERTKT